MTGHTQAHKYRLKVTAGTEYNPDTHEIVPVNADQSLRIENEHATVSLCVRIQKYTGYPDDSPKTNPYFSHPLHQDDQYSISFSIVFKHPVNGNDLLFGNDFDRPIRSRLPPGFNAALHLVKWTLDPAMDGDAYADKPYLYSPAVASLNQLRIGDKIQKGAEVPTVHDVVVEEGADGSGAEERAARGIPNSVAGRRKFFLSEEERKKFEFEPGRVYSADFGNPYLVFNDFSLRLPGFTVHATKYIDEKNHYLRYVLKDRSTNEVYFVVLFTLVLLGTEEEPGHKERIEQEIQESKARNEQTNGSLGKFDWEPEPAAGDVE
ncbi:DUF1769 domain-containing protein [Aspergillus clavatus NRRL 1]|uniref:Domain of unknown function at the cortex 1 domain-containing protein n=1 Tax=Aspergillus clavatus (strain ATCC 1007 / CBS 513.65 / DSM 816 / NCTC 3887 / NRRL 1 / QM 1276 / 107) TaxID=344612 RepID=A1CT30_ASPCL|nr:uncharacterized protein ACLA_081570 [Aspergillus clavatus NRRL 1]EAW06467.1 conserved hypothetical protein [Aspergillus clavatus NRRL 1]